MVLFFPPSTRADQIDSWYPVFPSADLDQAVKWSVLGVFENAGQSCSAGSRVLVHRSILKEFEERIKTVTESILVGSLSSPLYLAPTDGTFSGRRPNERFDVARTPDFSTPIRQGFGLQSVQVSTKAGLIICSNHLLSSLSSTRKRRSRRSFVNWWRKMERARL